MKALHKLLRKQPFNSLPQSLSLRFLNFRNFSITSQADLDQKLKCLSKLSEMVSYKEKKTTNNMEDTIIEINTLIQKNKRTVADQVFDKLVADCCVNGSIIKLDFLNTLLRSSFKINTGFQVKIHNYIISTKQEMNSHTIYYLIDFYLDYKGFNSAYNILVEASLLNINVDFNTVLSLYIKLEKVQDLKIRKSCKYFLENYVGRCFGEDDKQILKKIYLNRQNEKTKVRRGSSNALSVKEISFTTLSLDNENKKLDSKQPLKEEESSANPTTLELEKSKKRLKNNKKMRKTLASSAESKPSNDGSPTNGSVQTSSSPSSNSNSIVHNEIISEMKQESILIANKLPEEEQTTNTIKDSTPKKVEITNHFKIRKPIKNLFNETKRKLIIQYFLEKPSKPEKKKMVISESDDED